jgi:predicted alpha/beta superfamily hydrolase
MAAVASALAALLVAVAPTGEAAPSPACPDCGLRELRIDSKVLGEPRVARIRLPDGYARGGARYPVVYTLDGDDHLDHTAATAAFLARQGAMPPVLVVAVRNVDRNRDFTPSSTRELPGSGGADRFLAFLVRELVPAVESHFRTERFRILSGHSLGGLLALHALAAEPASFDAYLAASPVAGWDDGLVIRELKRRLEQAGPLDRTLFLSLGDEPGLRPGLDALESELRAAAPPGFRWRILRLPGDTHGIVPLASTAAGLRFVFDGFLPPRDPATGRPSGSADELEARYRQLSARLGFEVPPPEEALNAAGYALLAAGRAGDAVEVLRRNAGRHPGSANAQDSLGEALEAQGRLADAVAAYERAVELGEEQRSPFLNVFRTHLRAAQRKMQPGGPAGPGGAR